MPDETKPQFAPFAPPGTDHSAATPGRGVQARGIYSKISTGFIMMGILPMLMCSSLTVALLTKKIEHLVHDIGLRRMPVKLWELS